MLGEDDFILCLMELMDLLEVQMGCIQEQKLLIDGISGNTFFGSDILREVLFSNDIFFFLGKDIKLVFGVLKPRMRKYLDC